VLKDTRVKAFGFGLGFLALSAVTGLIVDNVIVFLAIMTGLEPPAAIGSYLSGIFLAPLVEEAVRYHGARYSLARLPGQSPFVPGVLFGTGWALGEVAVKLMLGVDMAGNPPWFMIPYAGFLQVPLMHILLSVLMMSMVVQGVPAVRAFLVCFAIHAVFNAVGQTEYLLNQVGYLQDAVSAGLLVWLVWLARHPPRRSRTQDGTAPSPDA
jgi:hypothetical protein